MIFRKVVAVVILGCLVGATWRAGLDDLQGATLLLIMATFLRVGQITPPAPRG